MKTYIPKLSDVSKKWYVVDVGGKIMGRQAGKIARILMGKNKPQFTPHLDVGDFVVVINAEKAVLSGKKPDQKLYWRYTGYPGGLKTKTFQQMINVKAESLFRETVRGMLPRNRLGRKMLSKLYVYRGGKHPHQAQKPEPLEL